MIVLNSVSKEVGRGAFRRLVVEGVTWTIPSRAQIAIFGHRGAGVSQFLEILAGTSLPTTGWVTRRGLTCPPSGYLKFAGFGTLRTLIERLSILYNVDPLEIGEFVESALQRRQLLDVPVKRFPPLLRRQLSYALMYAIPCDTYLFDGAISGGGGAAFRTFCQTAFNLRRKEAGMIVGLTSSAAGSMFDDSTAGAVLYRGRLTLYRHLSDAMAVFDALPPEEAIPNQVLSEEAEPEQEEFM